MSYAYANFPLAWPQHSTRYSKYCVKSDVKKIPTPPKIGIDSDSKKEVVPELAKQVTSDLKVVVSSHQVKKDCAFEEQEPEEVMNEDDMNLVYGEHLKDRFSIFYVSKIGMVEYCIHQMVALHLIKFSPLSLHVMVMIKTSFSIC